jgi:hypothetical protein
VNDHDLATWLTRTLTQLDATWQPPWTDAKLSTEEKDMTDLPDDTHLAYTDYREAWYGKGEKTLMVAASAKGTGGGVAWEFEVKEHDFDNHGKPIRIGVFDDAFDAFTQIPEFFAVLAAKNTGTLDEVIGVLRSMGAVDETDRTSPYTEATRPAERDMQVVSAAILAGAREPDEARKAAAAVLREISTD